jgi:DoxX-like family
MQSSLAIQPVAAPTLWTGRILGAFVVLFLVFDAFGKFMRPQPVVDAFARQGMPLALAPVIGSILSVLVVLYVIPKTRTLAAILLTGYLGGAVCANLRAGFPPFETVFPIITGVLAWAPLYLVDERVRSLFK